MEDTPCRKPSDDEMAEEKRAAEIKKLCSECMQIIAELTDSLKNSKK